MPMNIPISKSFEGNVLVQGKREKLWKFPLQ
jgi:hypothetical protein